jgi:thiamine-monophosphate kinase
VVKTDTIVSGVHFLADEKPELVAAARLRVCLSDLAAGGATPCPTSSRCRSSRLDRALGRRLRARPRRGQRRFGITLCGGDTTRTPGTDHRQHHRLRRVARGKGLGPRGRSGRG